MGVITNWFSKVFGSKTEKPNGSIIPLGWFNKYNESANKETNATYMSCVNANARHLSKVKFAHTLKGESTENKKDLLRMLNLRPNRLQTASQFWKEVASSYWRDQLALIYIEWDFTKPSMIGGFWPIDIDNVAQVSMVNGECYIDFTVNGQKHYVKESQLIVLKRNADSVKGLFGKYSSPISKSLQAIQASYDGLAAAIKASQYIRFVIQAGAPVSNDNMRKRQEEYAQRFLESNDGLIYVSGNEKLTEVSSNGKWPLAPELQSVKDDIYEFMGCTPEICKGKFDSKNWVSYYETTIEPLVSEICEELSFKLFTTGELNAGNLIEGVTDPMTVASIPEKIQIASIYIKEPVYVPNVANKLLGLPPVEGGDKPYQNKTYEKSGKSEDDDPDDPLKKNPDKEDGKDE